MLRHTSAASPTGILISGSNADEIASAAPDQRRADALGCKSRNLVAQRRTADANYFRIKKAGFPAPT